MQARIVPASRGARWLGEGWLMFRVAPLTWLAMVLAYLFGTQIVALVPVVGFVAALVAVPGLSVGLMGAARAASRGGPLRFDMLFDGFRNGWREQLVLGAVYLACSIAVFAGLSLLDVLGSLRDALGSGERPDPALLLSAAAAFGVLYVPVMMAFWFAPALAAWHGTGPAKALFFSFFACLINWRAFLAYGAVVMLAVVVVPLALLSLAVTLAGGGGEMKPLSLVLPLLIVVMPTLFASYYASYRDVFGGAE